jgi:methylated-DNA-[protein]-cysteine S-methyltransferase
MYYDIFPTACGDILLASTGDALQLLDFQQGSKARCVQGDWKRDAALFRPVREQVLAYLAGELREFSIAVAPQGTPFQQQVWQALQTIPYGETASYSDIATRIGRPKAVRAVGAANGANPVSLIIPCHRVIGSNGTLTGYAGGIETKARLLALEAGDLTCLS